MIEKSNVPTGSSLLMDVLAEEIQGVAPAAVPQGAEPVPSTRRCARCRQDKPMADFDYDARTKDGLSLACHTCVAERRSVLRNRSNRVKAGETRANRVKHGHPTDGKPAVVEIGFPYSPLSDHVVPVDFLDQDLLRSLQSLARDELRDFNSQVVFMCRSYLRKATYV